MAQTQSKIEKEIHDLESRVQRARELVYETKTMVEELRKSIKTAKSLKNNLRINETA